MRLSRRQLILGCTAASAAGIYYPTLALADTLRGVALVIGNANYSPLRHLPNGLRDANLIGSNVSDLGYSLVDGVIHHDIQDANGFRDLIEKLTNTAHTSDVVFFYYSGHGVQVNGENYLVPTKANPVEESDANFLLFNVNELRDAFAQLSSKILFLCLDACRDNPLRGTPRSLGDNRPRSQKLTVGRGLADMAVPRSTFIWYAAASGQEADDGVGNDSPFATAMARHMRTPAQSIYDFFSRTGWDVFQATNQGQQPELLSSPIPGNFYFLNREFVPWGSEQSRYQRRDVPLNDFRRGIFLNGLTAPTRKFAFGESYQVVNGKLDSSFQINSWDALPVATEYGDPSRGGDDVRYFWVRLINLPSVQAVFSPSSLCIDPQSYICFFFKQRAMFHISVRFLKINNCRSYDWIVSSLLGDEREFTLASEGKITKVVYHEESQWSMLDIFWLGIANDDASVLRG
jgi:hypothetical protein